METLEFNLCTFAFNGGVNSAIRKSPCRLNIGQLKSSYGVDHDSYILLTITTSLLNSGKEQMQTDSSEAEKLILRKNNDSDIMEAIYLTTRSDFISSLVMV